MKKKQKKILENKLNHKSFKTRPIFLEVQHYNYFHTAGQDNENDTKERFVGRKKIINKLLSFIHETTSNTGAYLVTGFRGMGKTSAVNKALATLNPISRSNPFIVMWILLMPIVVFWDNFVSLTCEFLFYSSSLQRLVLFSAAGIFVLCTIFILGYQDGRNKRIQNFRRKKSVYGNLVFFNKPRFIRLALKHFFENLKFSNKKSISKIVRKGIKFKDTLLIGVVSIFNPKFEKSKHSFSKNMRFIFILLNAYAIVLGCHYYLAFSTFSRHDVFWFITLGFIVLYFSVDFYRERLEYLKYKGSGTEKSRRGKILANKIGLIVILFLAYTVYLLNFFPQELFKIVSEKTYLLGSSTLLILFLFVYVWLKARWKRVRLRYHPNVYKGTLSELRTLFDFQQYIIVRVNLGKDNLTEKEVLKFVTNELLREYSKWLYNLKSIKRLANFSLLAFLLYFVITCFYHGFLGHRFTDFSINTLKLNRYFPSQYLVGEENLKLAQLEKRLFNNLKPEMKLEHYSKELETLKEQVSSKDFELDSIKIKVKEKREAIIGFKALDNAIKKSIYREKYQTILDMKLTSKYSGLEKGDSLTYDNGLDFVTFENSVLASSLSDDYPESSYSLWKKIHLTFGKLCNEIDYLSFKLWHSTRNIILSNRYEEKGSFLNDFINKIYPKVPILAVYVFMVVFLMFIRILPYRFRYIKGHNSVIRELKNIKKQIDASITFEQGGNASAFHSSWFNFRRQFTYQPLVAKDISQKLINVLDDINSLPFIFTKIRFVVVFDELDKISPHKNEVISSKEDEFESNPKEVRYQTRRKERIAQILSSMKHFLNSAKCKFIFIAGREMYDAALAGISDRESSLDSIFNENKIYVNSFYTEIADNSLSDLTSITEQYLCQFIIPEYYLTRSGRKPSLKTYKNYLVTYFEEKSFNDYDKSLAIEKIISSLKDFIVYLTYRSNGAPRKLSNLLERYLIPIKDKDLLMGDVLYVGNTDENLFLEIGYYNQIKFSFISYLTTPIFLGLGNYMHDYSDKLLVSISYMLDHLYKHHKFGISFRSLSLTPEIVDVNKEPQFREFLDKMIYWLSKNHLRPILSGIYDYKFNGKISAEIKFLSKLDELEGAAFNFTLDESIELKRHFNKRLEQLANEEKELIVKKDGSGEENHVNSIALVNVMIGDLHFYDEEYQEAIIHYMESIQNLRQKDIRQMNLYDFVLLVRNKLKLGLAFEKNKMFDNALMTYSELTSLVLKKRNIPLKKFGLTRFVIQKNYYNEQKELEKQYARINGGEKLKEFLDKKFKDKDLKEVVVIGRAKLSESNIDTEEITNTKATYNPYCSLEEMDSYYAGTDRELADVVGELGTSYKPEIHYFLQSTLENIRVLYQPIIAKLYLIEKSSPDKIKDIDLLRAIDEFNFLKRPLKTKDKRVVVSEFYNKIGDLLYFKNGTINKYLKHNIEIGIDRLLEFQRDFEEHFSQHGFVWMTPFGYNNNVEKTNALKNLLVSPIDATLFYIKSLAVLLIPNDENLHGELENEKLNFNEYYTNCDNFENWFKDIVAPNLNGTLYKVKALYQNERFRETFSSEYLSSVANGIMDLLETLICFTQCSYGCATVPKEFKYIYEALGLDIHDILKLYYIVHDIFKKIGEYDLAKSQLLKIIYLIKEVKEGTHFEISKIKEGLTLKEICNTCIRLTYRAYDHSYHVDTQKVDEIFRGSIDDESYYKISVAKVEVKEIMSLYWLCKYDLIKKSSSDLLHLSKNDELLDFYRYIYKNIHPFASTEKRQNRILELGLRLKANKDLYWMIEKEVELEFCLELLGIDLSNGDKNERISLANDFLILDSLGACNELLKTYYLFDVNYICVNHIILAKAHNTMAYWCGEYHKTSSTDEKEYLSEVLKTTVLNSETLMYVSENHHLNLALKFNQKAINFHSRGEPLINFLRGASYMDDFFNDNLVHFMISLERNYILERYKNNPDPIDNIKNRISEDKFIYNIDSYF